jgi:hypothetical protein
MMTRGTDKGQFFHINCVALEAIEIKRAGDSALSPITSGFIELRGTLHHISWPFDDMGRARYITIEFKGVKTLKLKNLDFKMRGYLDDASFSTERSAWAMQIAVSRRSELGFGKLNGAGLLLRQTSRGTFQRIGSFFSSEQVCWHLTPRQHRVKMADADVLDGILYLDPQLKEGMGDNEEETIVIV